MVEQYSSHPLINQTLGERYKVVRQIGQGSMGSVFEAQHIVLGRQMAIKVLKQDCSNPRLKERFFNEARAAGAINHQHIVQVYDFGLVQTGEPFIVMEFVDGESLQEYMDRAAPLSHQDGREVVLQILSAIEAIHQAGLVHRDVKPANMMLVKASRPKLFLKMLDFGIARAVNKDWDWPTLTRADEVLGTPVYLSPEQAGGGKADPRWDLWAVGVIMYEMLAGKLPFKTESLIQISTDIINHNLTPLHIAMPDLPRWMYELVERALGKNVTDRYQTAGDFLKALDKKQADDKRKRKNTLTGYQLPGGEDDEQPPELPPDVELEEEEGTPEGELKETDPVYLLQPKQPEQPSGAFDGDLDDMKETIVQQDPPQMFVPDDEAPTVAITEQPPPGPFEAPSVTFEPGEQSWTRGADEVTPGPISSEFTAEVNPDDLPPPPAPRRKGRETRELERQFKRAPVWPWLLLAATALAVGGVLIFVLTQQ